MIFLMTADGVGFLTDDVQAGDEDVLQHCGEISLLLVTSIMMEQEAPGAATPASHTRNGEGGRMSAAVNQITLKFVVV